MAVKRAVALLTDERAPQFRSRLLRELARFTSQVDALSAKEGELTPKGLDRARRRLQRAAGALQAAAVEPAFDRKAQGRLADDLGDLTSKLAELTEENRPASEPQHPPSSTDQTHA
jgi:hypothetical protein